MRGSGQQPGAHVRGDQCWSMGCHELRGLSQWSAHVSGHQCDTRHQGEQGIGHWSVRRSHWTADFTNLRKLERNCDKTSCLATLGGGQSLGRKGEMECADVF